MSKDYDVDFGKGHQSASWSDDDYSVDIDSKYTDNSDFYQSDDDITYVDKSSHEETEIDDSFNTVNKTTIEDSNINSNNHNEYTNDQDLVDLKGLIDVF